MNLREKINNMLDSLQKQMEENYHLENPEAVYNLTLNISKFWSVLSEEDRDYIQCAQYAIEGEHGWNLHDGENE
jgi:hypothetical protein